MIIAGIRFQQDGKIINYDAGDMTLRVGDFVVAETSRGLDLGEVMSAPHETADELVPANMPRITRAATGQDIQQATDNRTREREAFQICQRKIGEHKLEMKLVSVECAFDNSKMLFFFTANGRVDFRALVKDLASTFRTRIELRQIGVRDEARMLGGLGPCGRPICCGAFLSDFQPVSIRMAKDQSLSLNPTKISGVCGRLMCCLKYEQDQYEAIRKKMPRVGREVITPDGNGTVVELNIVKETVTVRIPNGDSTENRTYPMDQITRPGQDNRDAAQAAEPEISSDVEPAAAEDGMPEMSDELKELQEPDNAGENHGEKNRTGARPRRSRQEKNPDRFGPRSERGEKTEKTKESPEAGPHSGKPRPEGGKYNLKGKPSDREQKLGQPVRRENPERGRKPQAKPEQKPANTAEKRPAPGAGSAAAEPSAMTVKPEAGKKNAKSKGWADALEKAIQAADQ